MHDGVAYKASCHLCDRDFFHDRIVTNPSLEDLVDDPRALELRSAQEEAVLAAGGWRVVHAREKKPKPGEGKRKHESVMGGKSSKAKVASSSSVPE